MDTPAIYLHSVRGPAGLVGLRRILVGHPRGGQRLPFPRRKLLELRDEKAVHVVHVGVEPETKVAAERSHRRKDFRRNEKR